MKESDAVSSAKMKTFTFKVDETTQENESILFEKELPFRSTSFEIEE